MSDLTPVSYDLAGASKASGFSERTISDAIAAGDLIAHTLSKKPGSKKVIHRDDLSAWVKGLPVWEKAAS